VLAYHPQANLIVKVNTSDEKRELSDLAINSYVHAQHETALLLVKQSEIKPALHSESG
jgi:CPA2 family monovalent cation:H+ antiporter-2